MAVANTLAYYNMATITSVKSFKVQAPDLIQCVYFGVSFYTFFCKFYSGNADIPALEQYSLQKVFSKLTFKFIDSNLS